jgi:endonuclease-8
MPEGDTIHHAARLIRTVLEGRVPDAIATPHPRFGRERWPERLAGRRVDAVDAVGKHLLLRFEGGLVIHSHLRMTGMWRVLRSGERWPRSSRSAWLVVRRGEHEVVQFNGPVLELMTATRIRTDPRIAGLGPDLVAERPFDESRFLRRLREDDPTRTLGDALMDQRIVAGIGNFWKSEGCWLARVDPWRRIGTVTDEEALSVVRGLRPLMQRCAVHGVQSRPRSVYARDGLPCPRCGAPSLIRAGGQGDDNRTTYWCPTCQE